MLDWFCIYSGTTGGNCDHYSTTHYIKTIFQYLKNCTGCDVKMIHISDWKKKKNGYIEWGFLQEIELIEGK